MLPRLLTLEWGRFAFHLNGYGFSIFCGTLAALWIAIRRARASSLPLRPLLWVFALSVLGGFAGSKLAFVLQYGRLGGLVLYGGLLGGLVAALGASRRFGLAPLAVADLAAPCALLAASFGRLGCFFAGCCFGAPWDCGVAYPAASHAWRHHRAAGWIPQDASASLPTVPAPLLESIALLVIFAVASVAARRLPKHGRTLALCGLLYAAWRFTAEFWRGDHSGYWGALTFSQGISLVVVVAAILLWRHGAPSIPARPPAQADRVAWIPVTSMLLLVAIATGGVGCSAKERNDAANDIADDCINGCIDGCTDACEESCKQDRERRANGPRTAGEPGRSAPWLTLPPIEPAKPYAARLTLQGTLNETTVKMDVEGTFTVSTKDEAGGRVANLQISRLDLQLGDLSLSSAPGEAEIRVDAKGRAVFRSTTLSAETLSVLKSFESLSQGFLEIDPEAQPSKEWSDRIAHQLGLTDARAEIGGELALDRERHPFQASAIVTRTRDGDLRVQWLPRR